MSINRFLSRRDKSRSRRSKQTYSHFNGSFNDQNVKPAEHDTLKVKEIRQLLSKEQVGTFEDEDIVYAISLPYTNGEVQKTVEFLKFLQDSQDLMVVPYNPKVKFMGAVNRNMTTCYLDSLLFALFGCQDSFEPMLVNKFNDPKRDRLATLLRLWVNTQRAGKLVTVDITKQIQDALADCGWPEAAEVKQQDAGEAFTFICEQLGLPNLYLKMDLFHQGKEDANDDHKIVQERLLEMAIPDATEDGAVVKLEDCAEEALNAKVEVRRFMEGRQRRNTVGSLVSQRSLDTSKASTVHVEAVEIKDSGASSPVSARPQSPLPAQSPTRLESQLQTHSALTMESQNYLPSPLSTQAASSQTTLTPHAPLPYEHAKRPMTLQSRAPSIFKENVVPQQDNGGNDSRSGTRVRAGSMRKEVMMPAWQMYSLIPFYTDCSPESDAEVAHHFKNKQPTFGIRLKRYGFGQDGRPTRKQTAVDIPTEMAVPSFIRDDSSDASSGGLDNFKLSLVSAVCHRGNSTESGHYVSLARGSAVNGEDRWFLFDDLAGSDRVREVDIHEALKKETPYLLFFQVVPIDGNSSPGNASNRSEDRDSGVAGLSLEEPRCGSESVGRPSIDETSSFEGPRGRRTSLAFAEENLPESNIQTSHRAQNSLTVEQKDIPTRRPSRLSKSGSKSRHTSPSGSKRLSTSLNRITGKLSGSSDAVDRVPSQLTPSKPAANTMGNVVMAAQEKEKAKLKKKEEKSKHRRGHSSKHKNSKELDRECILM